MLALNTNQNMGDAMKSKLSIKKNTDTNFRKQSKQSLVAGCMHWYFVIAHSTAEVEWHCIKQGKLKNR